MILPRHVRSGRDAVERLRAAVGDAEAGDHLVEDRAARRAAAVTSRSAARKPGAGGTTPMLPATGSTMTAAISDAARGGTARARPSRSLNGDRERERGQRRRHARAVGDPERRAARAGLHEQAVGVAVVAAVELHEDVAPGGAARDADGAHGGLGARADEPHQLHRRIGGA